MKAKVVVSNLESERLFYKPVGLHNVTTEYLEWLNDPEVNKYLEVPKENTYEELKKYIQNTMDKKTFFWGIYIKDSKKHIGNIKIDPMNLRHGRGEYGIMIGDKREWGKGFANEASVEILNFCFKVLNLRKITLGVIEDNSSAVNLYLKLGFEVEGNYKKHIIFEGEYLNVLRMAIFNPCYK